MLSFRDKREDSRNALGGIYDGLDGDRDEKVIGPLSSVTSGDFTKVAVYRLLGAERGPHPGELAV
jgi:hypothetical protein